MSLAQRLETTATWAMGSGALSASFSLGRGAISYFRPEWDSILSFSKLLPNAQPLLRSAGWGAAFGAYQER